MDKFLTDIIGKMPIVLNDFRFVDSAYRHAFSSYLKAIKAENCILYGCNITHLNGNKYKIDEGAVAINAETFICDEATFIATNLDKCYFTVFESFDPLGNKVFGNHEKHDTYLLRRVKVLQHDTQPPNTLSVKAKYLKKMLIYEGDSRLTDSRRCNNTFDNADIARSNLSVYSKNEVYRKEDTYKRDELYNSDEISSKLNDKVDKVNGKELSTNDFTNELKQKLEEMGNNASNYTHPSTHPITMIEDVGNFVKMTKNERSKLSGIENNANKYTHPAKHPITMIDDAGDFVKMTQEERDKLNGIETGANNYELPDLDLGDIADTSEFKKVSATNADILDRFTAFNRLYAVSYFETVVLTKTAGGLLPGGGRFNTVYFIDVQVPTASVGLPTNAVDGCIIEIKRVSGGELLVFNSYDQPFEGHGSKYITLGGSSYLRIIKKYYNWVYLCDR